MTDGPRLAETIARRPEMRHWLALHLVLIGVAATIVCLLEGGSPVAAAAISAGPLAGAGLALAMSPDRMTTTWLRATPLLLSLPLAAGVIILAPNGGFMLLGGVYAGGMVPFLVPSRRGILAELGAITALLAGAVVVGGATTVTAVTLLCVMPVMWGLGIFIAIVWEQAEAQERELAALSQRDPLTGLANRRVLDDRIAYELARHAETDRPLSLIVLDLNGFKAINDRFGHAAGDAVLRDVAAALRAAVREQDTVARQGGDEFSVLAPETGATEARALAQTIRRALAAVSAPGRGLGAGLGTATYPDDGAGAQVLIAVADARQRADKPAPPADEVSARRSQADRR